MLVKARCRGERRNRDQIALGVRTLGLKIALIGTVFLFCASTTGRAQTNDFSGFGMEVVDSGLGGRLFDNWYRELDSDFIPDDETTPEPDGEGGPNGDGTLNNADGKRILNTGHQYRFKNLFGWDLLGNAGIYGRDHQKKPFVLVSGPASRHESREVWIQRLSQGQGGIPSYSDVLTGKQIAAIVDFMLDLRDGEIPARGEIWQLSMEAPDGFVLMDGGNAERGLEIYKERCANCHGADGTAIPFNNGEQNLGLHARYYGYAVAMKILSGDPGTNMYAQLDGLIREQKVQYLKDLLAALCDRELFPRGAATDPEVPDGDPRCGGYLK